MTLNLSRRSFMGRVLELVLVPRIVVPISQLPIETPLNPLECPGRWPSVVELIEQYQELQVRSEAAWKQYDRLYDIAIAQIGECPHGPGHHQWFERLRQTPAWEMNILAESIDNVSGEVLTTIYNRAPACTLTELGAKLRLLLDDKNLRESLREDDYPLRQILNELENWTQ
jgi:hypothetical protein